MGKQIVLPNVRKVIIPDPGYMMVEGDLKGADAQVVAWEAEDEDLKAAFRAGIDIHVKNAEDMWGSQFTCLPVGSHARDQKRQECKHTVHGCNYGCSPRTTASQRGWTVHEAERFHNRWFSLHPKIKTNYHHKVQKWLEKDRTAWNVFGWRRVYFDRIDESFTEALAWIPQSTVALLSYMGIFKIELLYEQWESLLQTHDSVCGQFPLSKPIPLQQLKKDFEVVAPYPDPLTIPWDIKISKKSWGEVEKPCRGWKVGQSECGLFCECG